MAFYKCRVHRKDLEFVGVLWLARALNPALIRALAELHALA